MIYLKVPEELDVHPKYPVIPTGFLLGIEGNGIYPVYPKTASAENSLFFSQIFGSEQHVECKDDEEGIDDLIDQGIYHLNGAKCSNLLMSIIWGLQQENGEQLVHAYLLDVCGRPIRFYSQECEPADNPLDKTYIINEMFQLKWSSGVWYINNLTEDDTTRSPVLTFLKYISKLREPWAGTVVPSVL